MKKIFFILAALIAGTANAEYLYGFGNISINSANYSSGTNDRRSVDDFVYLELEGGAGFDWGELYGFIDLENIEDGEKELRTATKGTITYKLGIKELRLYADTYGLNSVGFSSRNNVFGLSYQFAGDGWLFKPFIGINQVNDTTYTGFNGFQTGWVAAYNFKLGNQKFMLGNWHETEFSRDDEYLVGPEDNDLSANGAIMLLWNPIDELSTGLIYRYAHNKLGYAGYTNALTYTVKYNF